MPTIINQESFGSRLGGKIGEAAGAGLSSGLQQLANQKLERMQKKAAHDELRSAFPELPEESVAWISKQPAKQQWEILQTIGQQRQEQEQQLMQQQQQQQSGLQQLQQPQESAQGQDFSIPDEHYTPEVMQQLEQQLISPEAAQQFPPEELQRARNNLMSMQQKLSNNPVGQNPFPKEAPPVEKPKGIKLSSLVAPKNEKEFIKEEKMFKHKEEQAAKKEQQVINKETQKYYDRVLDTDKAAKEADSRLDKMEKLVKKGNLPNSALYGALKNVEEHVSPAAGAALGAGVGAAFGGIGAAPGAVLGGALGGLISPVTTLLRSGHRLLAPDTEEFEKLSNQFISGAKAVFGSRITDQDLKAYMAQIPTLSNSDAGKLKIIEDMKIANRADKVRAKAMKDIIKENGGNRPANLQLLVEERIADQLDQLSKEFVET